MRTWTKALRVGHTIARVPCGLTLALLGHTCIKSILGPTGHPCRVAPALRGITFEPGTRDPSLSLRDAHESRLCELRRAVKARGESCSCRAGMHSQLWDVPAGKRCGSAASSEPLLSHTPTRGTHLNQGVLGSAAPSRHA